MISINANLAVKPNMDKLVWLFPLHTICSKNPTKFISLMIFSALVSSCGGESTESGLFHTSPAETPIRTPGEPGMPEPTISATPTATPQTTSEPETGVTTPTLSANVNNKTLNVSWNNVSAASYRVLVWQDQTSAPIVVTTSNLNSSVALADAGNYTIMVEAYDALGNSVFSEPRFMEVTQ